MDSKLPTIKEIAQQLKVSVSTVSRALANHPRIGIGTRERVQKLAKEIGYEPNKQAIFFKQKRTFIIGVVLPFIREEFFSQAICGIETGALLHNYTILFGQSYDEMETEMKVVEVMKNQRVDGLIISLSKNTSKYAHLEVYKKHKIPVVYFDRVPPLTNINKVCCDIFKGTVEIVNWLYKSGCRRIALINGPEKMSASTDRLKGYMSGIIKQKLKIDMQLVEITDFSKESTYTAMGKLLSLKSPPDAIISFNDYVHMDAVQYAKQKKIKINKDILFASYANLPITDYTSFPPKISLEQYPYLQGEKAMELMINILHKMENEEYSADISNEEIIIAKLITH
ncbi:MAG TPA: LacI family DNA-binding transcriptional regulator [Chitinophagaceae bacterium]|jgi:DNA-binding LacI/PurR family transcriptional regulator|nr:LacI family DNA-binding transcriptional regulator [Chitinophagaceae bacterium]HMU57246.1 LacI family DNA-binding transcriptional regulator [Chitinophagaceae bacterium]